MDDPDLAVRRAREATLSGARPPAGSAPPRAEIAASWRRMALCGLDPAGGPEVAPLPEVEVERRRSSSGLARVVPGLVRSLESVVDAGQLVVVSDEEGRVLWRRGTPRVQRMADDLGFVRGSAWTEGNVGTNAIGTALVLGTPVQIRGGEHFVESHTRWGCAAAPVTDPWTGRSLGVVDVSGPSRTLHPAELALVEMAARLASLEIVEQHRARLDRLRGHAAPLLARIEGPALVVDRDGHLAASAGLRAPDRVALPDDLADGDAWLPRLGATRVESLPDGWLLRLDGLEDVAPSALVVDLVGDPEVRVTGPSGRWAQRLSRRHAEILLALVEAGPTGRTASELAADLFAAPGRPVTVRAEVSRLRRVLGGLLMTQPYRLAPHLDAQVRLPVDPRSLLPGSSAPVVLRLRADSPVRPGGGGT
ncbi:GAF domain-containing protein [Nocardioides ungokensis]|uniref:GAF domain-containing protein n=1 Tax=Nocardioides ungokensis TaxID=1643322 RepID=UPI0015DF64CD|nr:GAF domain-containing protein [Nocardioides ungokensis]